MIVLTAALGSVIEGLAVADAYAHLDSNVAYWDAIVDLAFQKADNEFNASVAAAAAAGAGLKHMFEWGTNGINRQATNMRPQPTEERARLWKTLMLNKGPKGGTQVEYEFKPSVANVPIPTTVPKEIRAMMRPHQFRWKAQVMEENEPVNIRRQEAEFLLIPYNPNLTGFKSYDIKRGYKLTKSDITAYPGQRTHGNFTAYWARFWAGRGPEAMGRVILAELDRDFLPLMATANRSTKKTRVTTDVVASVKARSKILQRETAAAAKARKVRHA